MSEIAMGLLGSGEFDPWSEPVERWLLKRARNGGGPVLVIPTASAHEGDASFDGWAEKGLAHYRDLGIQAEVLRLKTREDAHRDEFLGRLADASMVFFSGGNPARLAEIVNGTPFWDALCEGLRDGLAYAGCSAGVACLCEVTFDSDAQDMASVWAPGLGYVRKLLFAPHWDIVESWMPGATDFIVGSVRHGDTFVGIDEETAMVGDGRSWEVIGRAGVHVMRDGQWAEHRHGDVFALELDVAS